MPRVQGHATSGIHLQPLRCKEPPVTAARILAWTLVTAGALLTAAVVAALVGARGEPYGDPYEVFDDESDERDE